MFSIGVSPASPQNLVTNGRKFCTGLKVEYFTYRTMAFLAGCGLTGIKRDEIIMLIQYESISARKICLRGGRCTSINLPAQLRKSTAKMSIPDLPEPAFHYLESMLSRKFGKEIANYFSGNCARRRASALLHLYLIHRRLPIEPCLFPPH